MGAAEVGTKLAKLGMMWVELSNKISVKTQNKIKSPIKIGHDLKMQLDSLDSWLQRLWIKSN